MMKTATVMAEISVVVSALSMLDADATETHDVLRWLVLWFSSPAGHALHVRSVVLDSDPAT